jgi:hypothetical protein
MVKMPLCVADNARMVFVNQVNSVNLSTNFKNPAANTNARVLSPVSFRNAQGPQRPLNTLCNCTGELCIHPVRMFTKLGTCSLTKSRGFPTPCPNEYLRGPGILWNLLLTFAGGTDAAGERGYMSLKAVLLMLLV